MGTIDWKDAAARAAKTFVAVFLVSAPAEAVLNGDVAALKAAAVSAGAAALTLVWNVLLDWSRS